MSSPARTCRFGAREGTIAILEGAVGKVGQAVAQHAAKAWPARRRKSRDRTASLSSLAVEELSSIRQRDRLDHLIAGIGHQVGDQLEPLPAAKFTALPPHEHIGLDELGPGVKVRYYD